MLSFISGIFAFIWSFWDNTLRWSILSIIGILLGVLLLFFWIKRLHDVNMSWLRIIPFLVILLSFLGSVGYMLISWGALTWDRKPDFSLFTNLMNSQYWVYILAFYGICGLISFLISLRISFFKSVNENNRFWPDPLRNITVGNSSYRMIVIVFMFLSMFLDSGSKQDNNEIDTIPSDVDSMVGRLDNAQISAQNMVKQADLNMIWTALEVYNADYDLYPIRESFVSADTLSTVLTWEYIREFPEWSQEYFYKTITRDSQPNKAFILMVKINNTSKYNKINYVWDKSGLESKTFEEIQTLLDNYTSGSWDQQWWYVYLSM